MGVKGVEMEFEIGLAIVALVSLLAWLWAVHRKRKCKSTQKKGAESLAASGEKPDILPQDLKKEPEALAVEASAPEREVLRTQKAVEVEIRQAAAMQASEPAALDKRSLADALAPTKKGLFGRIRDLVMGHGGLKADELEELEEILYTSDLGPRTVQHLMAAIEERLGGKERSDFDAVRAALRSEMKAIFAELDGTNSVAEFADLTTAQEDFTVIMVVGVNGAGKTTTIGKLASQLVKSGKKVLIAAGDTFRAAADSQLRVWSERAGVDIFSPENVKDPSAVAYDACQIAKARGFGVLIVDTAGRLHTQKNLMEELKKMKRVITKVVPSAPHQVLLVLDANSGQNALIQAKEFHEALGVTGVILTKLDGSAKGGVAVGLVHELRLPIKLIGVGEGLEDLRPFSASEFVDSIL